MTHQLVDLALCQQQAALLQPKFDALLEVYNSLPSASPLRPGEADTVKERLLPYAKGLYITYREFDARTAIMTVLLNTKKSLGVDATSTLIISLCFSSDGLDTCSLIEAFKQDHLHVSREDLLAFGEATNAIMQDASQVDELIRLAN